MSNLKKLKQVILVLSCMGAVLPLRSHLSSISAGIVFGLFLWRWAMIVTEKMRPSSVVMQVVAAAAFGTAFVFGGQVGAGITLDDILTSLCVALTLKLFETSRPRDFVVIYVFDLLLIGVDLCYGRDGLTWLLCALSLALLLIAMSLFQDRASIRSVTHSCKSLVGILCIATPLTCMFISVAPPDGMPKWSLLDGKKPARTGVSDSMAPGDVSSLALSDDLAFSGRFTSSTPYMSRVYWRSGVLDHFDGSKWTVGKERWRRRGLPDSVLNVRGDAIAYEITLEPSPGYWVPVLDAVTSIDSLSRVVGVGIDAASLEVRGTRLNDGVANFRVVSHLAYELDPKFLPGQDLFLQLPTNNQRTTRFARHLRNAAGTDEKFVGAVLNKFKNESFFYTLKPAPAGRLDPVDDFLFETKQGFCEHYASAFVVMMRSAGIPSRVVIGYQGATEIDYTTGKFSVNQSEAHAWAEYWIKGRGWIRADPTGFIDPSRVSPKPAKSAFQLALAKLGRLTGSASGFFKFGSLTSSASSDLEQQRDLTSDGVSGSRVATQTGKDAIFETIGGVVLCLGGVVGLVHCRRRRERVRRDRLGVLQRHYFIVTQPLGLSRDSDETLREFLVRASQSSDAGSAASHEVIIGAIEASLYRDTAIDDAWVSGAQSALADLKGRLTAFQRLKAELKIAIDIYL